jgi:hypothetical protein
MEVAGRRLWRLAELPARCFRTFVGGRQDRNVAKVAFRTKGDPRAPRIRSC